MPGAYSRRQFGNALAAVLGAGALPATAAPVGRENMRLIKPARLREGDLVGLIAPGGHTNDAALAQAVSNIESLGLRVRLGENINYVYGNYGGTVEQRIADLHAMFLDPEIKAVWAVRGGSGCISLLEHIDYRLIRAHPKVLIGYSDITCLHLALLKKAGLVTFHGPVGSSTFSEYSVAQMRSVLMTPQDSYTIAMCVDNPPPRTVHGGVATGRLIGGNLSLVSALAGTPYAADFKDCILYLEEVNEEPYRIDRMMTQLQLSQGYRNAAAVVLGIFENCEGADGESALSLDDTVDQHLLPLTRPAVAGYSFGHIRNQFTIPVGLRAKLDTRQQTLTLLESAII
ncbi:LD-carboxypeptidase [Duganella sp. HH105]|uniref:S66 peptidase family protein n=1 Tax=Duganella sp. HH105 TaxID=1781067 RepID=UPI000877D903|nr:LD-carboxypeptidase [Duganella sp. HH105]OEZ63804.1 putative murein peptide carboxypeptidase [Duganella sp. HH105]